MGEVSISELTSPFLGQILSLKCPESPWAFFFLYAKWASLLCGLLVKNPSEIQETNSHTGDPGSIPGFGRSPGEGNGNPLQYSCLENLMHWGAWWATVHGVTRVVHDLVTKPPTTIGKRPPYNLAFHLGCPLRHHLIAGSSLTACPKWFFSDILFHYRLARNLKILVINWFIPKYRKLFFIVPSFQQRFLEDLVP